ncbi:MAG: type IV pilus assembly protein PilM [Armatimonadetes bacterium]|nr:type IV pilus assembly protein PilM [Armatimonadota bacterium]
MAKKLNSAIGVDIGSQTIKLVEIRLQGNQPTVTAMSQAMTPEGAVDHFGVHDDQAVGAVLKELISSSGASASDVVVSIAGQGSVLVRTLEVPKMTDGELAQHMDWEITRNIPFGEKTIESDYKAFPSADDQAQNMDVVMAISPQSAVELMASVVKKAGKKTAAIDVEPLGIARSLAVTYDSDYHDKTLCVVDIGHKTTSINIYRNGQLLMPRLVPIGGQMFTQAIADAKNIGFEEAEQIKIKDVNIPADAAQQMEGLNPFDADAGTQAMEPYNPFSDSPESDKGDAQVENPPAVVDEPPSSGGEPDELFAALADVLDEMIAEIRRSVDYYRSKGGDVDHVLLSGGGSKLKGLQAFIEASVGLSVSQYDPLKGVVSSIRKPDASVDESHCEEFVIAVGNALHVAF